MVLLNAVFEAHAERIAVKEISRYKHANPYLIFTWFSWWILLHFSDYNFIFYLTPHMEFNRETFSLYSLQMQPLFTENILSRLMRPSTLMNSPLTCHVPNPMEGIVFPLFSFTAVKELFILSGFYISCLLSHGLLFSQSASLCVPFITVKIMS